MTPEPRQIGQSGGGCNRISGIVDNLASLAREGRRILGLSQRKDHLDTLAALLTADGLDPLLLPSTPPSRPDDAF